MKKDRRTAGLPKRLQRYGRRAVSVPERWRRYERRPVKFPETVYRLYKYGRKACAGMLVVFLACSVTGCGQMEKVLEAEAEAGDISEDSRHAAACAVTLTEGKYSEEKLDDTWEEAASVQIELEEDEIRVREPAGQAAQTDSSGETEQGRVKITENQVRITQEGTYVLSGTLEDGQIMVDADKEDLVRLVLNGVDLNCSSSAPIYSKSGNVVIILAEGSQNSVADGMEYVYEEGEDEPKAAIFAKDDLTFNGTGTLSVTGNYNHGIQCKDDLKFITGTYVVRSAGDGIVGKDSITVRNGNFTVDSGGDGLKSTNVEESDKGYVLIENGSFQITSAGDGIQAETLLRVNDGNIDITSGGGSQEAARDGERPMEEGEGSYPEEMTPEGTPPEGLTPPGEDTPQDNRSGGFSDAERPADRDISQDNADETRETSGTETESAKGLKSYVELIIAGGEFHLDTCDDGIHSNQNVTIQDGSFTIHTGDDGIHADQTLTIQNGSIDIRQSYEGLEGFAIVIAGGDVKIEAADDGINAAGDSDRAQKGELTEETARSSEKPEEKASEGTPPEGTPPEGLTPPGQGASQDGRSGELASEDQGASLTIQGGTVWVNADGDGLDANGDIFIEGGDVTVHGPVNGGNGTLDYASVCQITGGTFVGIGSAGMAQNPSEDSTQSVIVWRTNSSVEAGTVITVSDQEGRVLIETATEKAAQWFAVSSPEFSSGGTYKICVGNTEKEVNLSQAVTEFLLEK